MLAPDRVSGEGGGAACAACGIAAMPVSSDQPSRHSPVSPKKAMGGTKWSGTQTLSGPLVHDADDIPHLIPVCAVGVKLRADLHACLQCEQATAGGAEA